MIQLLQKLPQTRICNMKTLRRHAFLRNVNLEALYNRQVSQQGIKPSPYM